MKSSRYSTEQVAFCLRQAEDGTPVAEVCRKMGISEQTFYRWKKKFQGIWGGGGETAAGRGRGKPLAPAAGVTADAKMSENAGNELTHRIAQASFTKISWRCWRHFAKGGTSERDLRNERGGTLHPGDRRGSGRRPEHGSAVPQVPGGHAAKAPAAAGIQAGPRHAIC